MLSVIQRMLQCFMWIFTGQILLLYRRIYAAAEQVTSAMLVRVWEEIDNIWDICRINNRSHNGHLYFKVKKLDVFPFKTTPKPALYNSGEGKGLHTSCIATPLENVARVSHNNIIWGNSQSAVDRFKNYGKNRSNVARKGRTAVHWITCEQGRTAVQGVLVNCSEGEKPQSTGVLVSGSAPQGQEPQCTEVLVSGSGGKNRRELEYLLAAQRLRWEESQSTGVLVIGSGGKNRRELEYLLAAQVGRAAEHWSTCERLRWEEPQYTGVLVSASGTRTAVHWSTCERLRWEEPQYTGVLVSGSGGKNRRALEYLLAAQVGRTAVHWITCERSGGKNRRALEYLLAAQVGRTADHWSTCERLRWEEPQYTGVLVSGSGGKNRSTLENTCERLRWEEPQYTGLLVSGAGEDVGPADRYG
ncbi:hypothetical protein J6590_010935 [Homalodisca vitripennis]|nr:hypothetical protein J6590_010935 [Homalodisca vitripennis]